jgi:hypothetical protein
MQTTAASIGKLSSCSGRCASSMWMPSRVPALRPNLCPRRQVMGAGRVLVLRPCEPGEAISLAAGRLGRMSVAVTDMAEDVGHDVRLELGLGAGWLLHDPSKTWCMAAPTRPMGSRTKPVADPAAHVPGYGI